MSNAKLTSLLAVVVIITTVGGVVLLRKLGSGGKSDKHPHTPSETATSTGTSQSPLQIQPDPDSRSINPDDLPDAIAKLQSLPPGRDSNLKIEAAISAYLETDVDQCLSNLGALLDLLPENRKEAVLYRIGKQLGRVNPNIERLFLDERVRKLDYIQKAVLLHGAIYEAGKKGFDVRSFLQSLSPGTDEAAAVANSEDAILAAAADPGFRSTLMGYVKENELPSILGMIAQKAKDSPQERLEAVSTLPAPRQKAYIEANFADFVERDVNGALRWLERSEYDAEFKRSMIKSNYARIANWDKVAADEWLKRF
jgi:hypothetical protein